jgi:hypothetical protein
MAVSTRITHGITASHTSALSTISGGLTVSLASLTISFADGNGNDQANRVYRSSRSLAISTSENIDLYDFAGATDALGQTYALSKVKALAIRNTSTDTGATITIGAASSNPWTGPLGGTTPTITLTPGTTAQGVLLLVNGAGWTVTDASAHLLKIINNSGSVTASYEIAVVGSQ